MTPNLNTRMTIVLPSVDPLTVMMHHPTVGMEETTRRGIKSKIGRDYISRMMSLTVRVTVRVSPRIIHRMESQSSRRTKEAREDPPLIVLIEGILPSRALMFTGRKQSKSRKTRALRKHLTRISARSS